MKPLKILAAVVATLLALVLIAVGALYALFDAAKIKGELAATMQQKYQRTLEIGVLELSVWPSVGVKLDKLSLSEPRQATPFVQLDSMRVAVEVMPLLSKRIVAKAIEVNGLRATVIKHKDGSLSIADLTGSSTAQPPAADGGKPQAASASPALDIAAIKINDVQFTWRDEKTGATTMLSNLALDSGRIKLDGGAVAVDALALTARLKDAAHDAAATLSITGVSGDAQALKVGKFALSIDAKMHAAEGDTAVQGRIESPVALRPADKAVTLEKLAGELNITNPKMPMKQLKLPLSGSAFFDGGKQKAGLDLNTAFDKSKIAARIGASGFEPLALNVALDIDQLNLDKYLPPAPKTSGKADSPAPATGTVSAGDDKIDLSALKTLNLNGALKIGKLQVRNIKLNQVNAKLAAAGGRLTVAPLALNLYEGSLNGSLAVNTNGNVINIKQNLANVSIAPLLKDVADKDLLEGRGNIALDLNTQGATVSALKKALAGSASLSLKDGAIKGINLAQSLRDVKAKLGGAPAEQQAKAGEKTDFSELTASFKIAQGVAKNDDLAMKSPFIRLGGAGEIDIAGGSLNYLAKASVVNSSAGQGGKGADQLAGVTVPVRISGPFDKLSYKLELGSLVSDSAKAKVEEKKQELKGKVEDQLKGQLKGLLGR